MSGTHLKLLALVSFSVCLAGCSAKARSNWVGEFLGGMVESAVFNNSKDENRNFREPGLTRQEAKERYANYERYQETQNGFLDDYKKKEAAEQRERDAALLKGWLKDGEWDRHTNRDRSKDLF